MQSRVSSHTFSLSTLSSSSRGTFRDSQSHPYNKCLVYHCPRGVPVASWSDVQTNSARSFNKKEQWLYSKFPHDVWASHLISKAQPIHSPEEPHFSCFYQQFYPFFHYPKLETKGEGQDLNGRVKSRSSSKLQSSSMPTAIPATHNHDSALSQHPAMKIRKQNWRRGAVLPLTEHTQRTCLT